MKFNGLLVSFEVTSLFTKVPILDSVAIVQNLLDQDDKCSDLLPSMEKYLTSTYLLYQWKFYKQTSGFLFSPVLMDIFMKNFTVALALSPNLPKVWLRYFIFIICLHRFDSEFLYKHFITQFSGS